MTPELDDDPELRRAFRDLADAATPYVRPPGAARAQLTARRRVRAQRLTMIGAAALAILVPTAIVALAQGRGGSSLPQPHLTEPVTTTPVPTPTVTSGPEPTYGPDGLVVEGPGDLANATLTLSWPDPDDQRDCGGTYTVPARDAPGLEPGPNVVSTMRLDLDGDGEREIVAYVYCLLGQVGPAQIVAVRLGADPTVLATVVATGSVTGQGMLADPDGPYVATINAYHGAADGTVLVEVGDRRTCCGTPPESSLAQVRRYAWTGSDFQQVDGPTSFVTDLSVADVEVSVPTLAFSAPSGGFRTATLTITIRNNGPQGIASAVAFVEYPFGIEEPSGGDWRQCLDGHDDLLGVETYALCQLGSIAAGQTVTLTLPMRRASEHEAEENPHFSTYTGRVEVRTAGRYPPVTFAVTAA